MTKPKRWFLESTLDGVLLKGADGECIKKPNAKRAMGRVVAVEVPDSAQVESKKVDPDEAILFKCESASVILSLSNHVCTRGLSTEFVDISSNFDFLLKWDELEESRASKAATVHGPNTPTLSGRSTAPSRSQASTSNSTPKRTGAAIVSKGVLSCDQPSPSKKRKFMSDAVDEAIERAKKGVMELPTSQLSPPHESRLLRSADATFMSHLKKRMLADPSSPGACPMAVICLDMTDPNDFQPKYKDVYKYEVLGGLHSSLCKNQLTSDNPYFKVALADVYVGLSDEQALRLARRHNDNSHFVHRVTHRDLVEACRARLYAINDLPMSEDTPKPSAQWKDSCLKAIIPKEISLTHRDNIFAQAALSKNTWSLATQDMDLYEQAKLKSQKLRLSTLLHKPEFKQNYLSPIRTLPVEEQCSLLRRVVDLELSLSELQSEANRTKQFSQLKGAFTKLTNSSSWNEAEEKFPHFASETQLERFLHVDLKKSIPKIFADFCHRAKTSLNETPLSDSSSHNLVVRGNRVSVVQSPATKINGSLLRKVDPSFNGANLVVTLCTPGNAENVAYTMKEINSYFGCYEYVTVAVASVDNYIPIASVWEKAFVKSELLFVAETSNSRASTATYLTPCMKVAVLGFFSTSEGVSNNLIHFPPDDPRYNFREFTKQEELFDFLVNTFSPVGSVVLRI